MFKIYLIRNIENGKVYVGKTCQEVGRRWGNHQSAARKGSSIYFYRAVRKYGPNKFKVQTIATCPTQEEANRLETYWITQIFKSHIPELGYNGTLGGDGTIPNAETLEKIREAGRRHKKHTPEAIEKIRAAMTGRVLSAETRKKMSDYRKKNPSGFLKPKQIVIEGD